MYRQGVIGILVNDGRVLLIKISKEKGGGWKFPTGGLDDGESYEDAAVREIKEEVNIDSVPIKRLNFSHKYDWPKDKLYFIEKQYGVPYIGQEQVPIILKPMSEKLLLDSREIEKAEWVKISELKKYLSFSNQEKLFDKIIEELSVDESSG